MLDLNVFRLIREQDFLMKPALDLRPFVWGSLAIYADTVQNRLSTYHSKYDLLHWLTFWTQEHRLMSPFDDEPLFKELYERSYQVHQDVIGQIFTTPEIAPEAHHGYDNYNAIDSYVVETQCPDAKTILDFGAGYGRLGAIFASPARGGTYIAVDCIEISYMLQNLFLSRMAPGRFHEYVDYALQRTPFDVTPGQPGTVFHVPSWRFDLIPDDSIDAITAVFILPEINEFALLDFIAHARRVLRPGGAIYLRDHLYHIGEANHKGGHRLDTPALLDEAGFKITYQGDYEDNVEIYGIPRVYRKS